MAVDTAAGPDGGAQTSPGIWLKSGLGQGKLGVAAMIAMLAVLPLAVGAYDQRLIVRIMAYAIAVIGLDLITGRAGILSFGQSGFLAIGAYGSVILMTHGGLSFAAALCATLATAAVVGAVLALAAVRLSGLSFALVSFMFAFVMTSVIGGDDLRGWTGAANGLATPPGRIFGATLENLSLLYYFTLCAFAVGALIHSNIVGGRSGRGLRTMKENELVAASLGVRVPIYKVWSFALAGVYAAVGGMLLSQSVGYISPESYGVEQSIFLVAMLTVGGIRRTLGPLVGAAFFVLLPEYVRFAQQNSAIVFGAIFLIALIVAPQGLVGVASDVLSRRRGRS